MGAMRLAKEEVSRRGRELFSKAIEQQLTPGDTGKYLVIDVDSGAYELGDDYRGLIDRMRAQRGEPNLYTMRVGHASLGRIGGRLRAGDR